jgi:putative intracellular protease/amidase
MRILFPLPDEDFDPTESAIPWLALTQAGHEVVFATPSAQPARGDPRVLTGKGFGPWKAFLQAIPHARETYAQMIASPAFGAPQKLDLIEADAFDGVHLTGGHAPGMRRYLDSSAVHRFVATHTMQGKPVGAICHGVLAVARAKDPSTGRSVLYGRKTTALMRNQELTAWALTGLWLGSYYRTYRETVAQEVEKALQSPMDFINGPFSLTREAPDRPDHGFTVRDGNYLSARFYGDSYKYAHDFVALIDAHAAGRRPR